MKSNERCDELGMDTVSCGNTVAAYLASEDEFGNSELVHELVEGIAYREGVGDKLAEGIDRIHEDLGVENWSVKGLEFAAHDGRVCHGQGLSYAVSNRGADHLYGGLMTLEYSGELDPEGLDGKPEALVEHENRNALRDSGIFCAFSGSYLEDEHREELLDADIDELLEVGARTVELERHFHNRRGRDRDDDRVPYEEQLDDFEAALAEYYELRGWNDDGTIPEEEVPA
jgi:aldehyde:ferredoxin oxidoreductase